MCLEMSDYVGGQWISVRVCVLPVRVYIFVSISMFQLASSQIRVMCEIMYRETSAHIQENEGVHTQKSSCFLFDTHTHKHVHIHFLW